MELLKEINKYQTIEYISRNKIAIIIRNIKQFKSIREKILRVNKHSNIEQWNLESFIDTYKAKTCIDLEYIESRNCIIASFADNSWYKRHKYKFIEEEEVL